MIIAISIKMERKRSATTSLGGQRVRGIRKSISSILLKIALEIIKDGFKESFKSFFHNFLPLRNTGYVIPIPSSPSSRHAFYSILHPAEGRSTRFLLAMSPKDGSG
jgi:hypothetical protein